MHDRISAYCVARLSIHMPHREGAAARYALIANTIVRGVPRAKVLVDGELHGLSPRPTTEEILEAFDAAIRQHMLH